MKYYIDKTSSAPAYLQIYKELRKDITSGIYQYGDRLPSKRTLAEDTGTSVITTDHAFQLLLEEGYVDAKERSGYYCIYKEGENLPVGDQAEDVADENGPLRTFTPEQDTADSYWNPPEDFPFSIFAKTMRRVLSQYGEKILIKSPNFGIPELRQAIAAYLARSRGILVHPEQVVIGSGSEYMYSLIVQMLGRDKLYGLENPSYHQIQKVYEACGAKTELLDMGSHGIRSSALRTSDAQVLHITPFHSYPSGVTADASKRSQYIRWAQKRKAVIIEDDMDSEFTMSTKAEDTLFSLEPRHTVIYMNTFSRTIAPSIRSGYMVLPSDRADALKEKISFYSCTVPVFEQYVLTEFIRSGDFERHINRVRRKLRKSRGQL